MCPGVTASCAFITLWANQTHTMERRFLRCQAAQRSRLVIGEFACVLFSCSYLNFSAKEQSLNFKEAVCFVPFHCLFIVTSQNNYWFVEKEWAIESVLMPCELQQWACNLMSVCADRCWLYTSDNVLDLLLCPYSDIFKGYCQVVRQLQRWNVPEITALKQFGGYVTFSLWYL